MDNLIIEWKEAKKVMEQPVHTAEQLISIAKEKKKSVLYFHYGTIVILVITFIGIGLFFYYVLPLHTLLSITGIGFMLCGLLLRITIEIFSSIQSNRITLINDTSKTTNSALNFYKFRKKIHDIVSIIIVAFYIIGFYLLSPELSKYISLKWMIIIDSSFAAAVIFLIWQIRKGIKKELKNLSALAQLHEEITKTI